MCVLCSQKEFQDFNSCRKEVSPVPPWIVLKCQKARGGIVFSLLWPHRCIYRWTPKRKVLWAISDNWRWRLSDIGEHFVRVKVSCSDIGSEIISSLSLWRYETIPLLGQSDILYHWTKFISNVFIFISMFVSMSASVSISISTFVSASVYLSVLVSK